MIKHSALTNGSCHRGIVLMVEGVDRPDAFATRPVFLCIFDSSSVLAPGAMSAHDFMGSYRRLAG